LLSHWVLFLQHVLVNSRRNSIAAGHVSVRDAVAERQSDLLLAGMRGVMIGRKTDRALLGISPMRDSVSREGKIEVLVFLSLDSPMPL